MKCCRPGQATDHNMAYGHCMLDTQGYKHSLRICNIYLFLHCNVGCMNAPQCYVICTLPVLCCSRALPSSLFFIDIMMGSVKIL